MVLAEKSDLIDATNKDTILTTPISVSDFTDTSHSPSKKTSNLTSIFPAAENYDDPISEP